MQLHPRKVTVQEWLDGSVHIVYKCEEIAFEEIVQKPVREKKPESTPGKITHYKPPADHPWRQYKIRPVLVPHHNEIIRCRAF